MTDNNKYYYFKAKSRITGEKHRGYYTMTVIDRLLDKLAPDGYTEFECTAMIGDFDYNTVYQWHKRNHLPIVS